MPHLWLCFQVHDHVAPCPCLLAAGAATTSCLAIDSRYRSEELTRRLTELAKVGTMAEEGSTAGEARPPDFLEATIYDKDRAVIQASPAASHRSLCGALLPHPSPTTSQRFCVACARRTSLSRVLSQGVLPQSRARARRATTSTHLKATSALRTSTRSTGRSSFAMSNRSSRSPSRRARSCRCATSSTASRARSSGRLRT